MSPALPCPIARLGADSRTDDEPLGRVDRASTSHDLIVEMHLSPTGREGSIGRM